MMQGLGRLWGRVGIIFFNLFFLAGFASAATNHLWLSVRESAEGRTNLGIEAHIPSGFENPIEIFTCTNLLEFWWTLAETNLLTEGTDTVYWTYQMAEEATGLVYVTIGNAEIDSDRDGLSDARERFLYHTSGWTNDTDGDGLSDYEEIVSFRTDPLNGDTDGDGFLDRDDLVVTLFSPSSNTCFRTNLVPVQGQVAFTGAECRIWANSKLVQAVVTNGPIRSFSITVPFSANGSNQVSVRADGFLGEAMVEGCTSVPVQIEAYPPNLTILAPADEQVIDARNVHVAVLTDDETTVTVNGITATRDGYIHYAWVPLTPGTNAIVAESANALGQIGSDSVTVVCDVLPETLWEPVPDQDMDGVLDENDPEPNNPSIKSILRVSAPINGIAVWLEGP